MPIEIREIVIRATITPPGKVPQSPQEDEQLRRKLVEDCANLVVKKLRKNSDR